MIQYKTQSGSSVTYIVIVYMYTFIYHTNALTNNFSQDLLPLLVYKIQKAPFLKVFWKVFFGSLIRYQVLMGKVKRENCFHFHSQCFFIFLFFIFYFLISFLYFSCLLFPPFSHTHFTTNTFQTNSHTQGEKERERVREREAFSDNFQGYIEDLTADKNHEYLNGFFSPKNNVSILKVKN